MAYGVLVLSTVAKGRVTKIDAAAAEKAPGVLAVVSHRNAGKVVLPEKAKALVDPKVGRPLQAFQDDQVHYHGQPIAVVVADTFERPRTPPRWSAQPTRKRRPSSISRTPRPNGLRRTR